MSSSRVGSSRASVYGKKAVPLPNKDPWDPQKHGADANAAAAAGAAGGGGAGSRSSLSPQSSTKQSSAGGMPPQPARRKSSHKQHAARKPLPKMSSIDESKNNEEVTAPMSLLDFFSSSSQADLLPMVVNVKEDAACDVVSLVRATTKKSSLSNGCFPSSASREHHSSTGSDAAAAAALDEPITHITVSQVSDRRTLTADTRLALISIAEENRDVDIELSSQVQQSVPAKGKYGAWTKYKAACGGSSSFQAYFLYELVQQQQTQAAKASGWSAIRQAVGGTDSGPSPSCVCHYDEDHVYRDLASLLCSPSSSPALSSHADISMRYRRRFIVPHETQLSTGYLLPPDSELVVAVSDEALSKLVGQQSNERLDTAGNDEQCVACWLLERPGITLPATSSRRRASFVSVPLHAQMTCMPSDASHCTILHYAQLVEYMRTLDKSVVMRQAFAYPLLQRGKDFKQLFPSATTICKDEEFVECVTVARHMSVVCASQLELFRVSVNSGLTVARLPGSASDGLYRATCLYLSKLAVPGGLVTGVAIPNRRATVHVSTNEYSLPFDVATSVPSGGWCTLPRSTARGKNPAAKSMPSSPVLLTRRASDFTTTSSSSSSSQPDFLREHLLSGKDADPDCDAPRSKSAFAFRSPSPSHRERLESSFSTMSYDMLDDCQKFNNSGTFEPVDSPKLTTAGSGTKSKVKTAFDTMPNVRAAISSVLPNRTKGRTSTSNTALWHLSDDAAAATGTGVSATTNAAVQDDSAEPGNGGGGGVGVGGSSATDADNSAQGVSYSVSDVTVDMDTTIPRATKATPSADESSKASKVEAQSGGGADAGSRSAVSRSTSFVGAVKQTMTLRSAIGSLRKRRPSGEPPPAPSSAFNEYKPSGTVTAAAASTFSTVGQASEVTLASAVVGHALIIESEYSEPLCSIAPKVMAPLPTASNASMGISSVTGNATSAVSCTTSAGSHVTADRTSTANASAVPGDEPSGPTTHSTTTSATKQKSVAAADVSAYEVIPFHPIADVRAAVAVPRARSPGVASSKVHTLDSAEPKAKPANVSVPKTRPPEAPKAKAVDITAPKTKPPEAPKAKAVDITAPKTRPPEAPKAKAVDITAPKTKSPEAPKAKAVDIAAPKTQPPEAPKAKPQAATHRSGSPLRTPSAYHGRPPPPAPPTKAQRNTGRGSPVPMGTSSGTPVELQSTAVHAARPRRASVDNELAVRDHGAGVLAAVATSAGGGGSGALATVKFGTGTYEDPEAIKPLVSPVDKRRGSCPDVFRLGEFSLTGKQPAVTAQSTAVAESEYCLAQPAVTAQSTAVAESGYCLAQPAMTAQSTAVAESEYCLAQPASTVQSTAVAESEYSLAGEPLSQVNKASAPVRRREYLPAAVLASQENTTVPAAESEYSFAGDYSATAISQQLSQSNAGGDDDGDIGAGYFAVVENHGHPTLAVEPDPKPRVSYSFGLDEHRSATLGRPRSRNVHQDITIQRTAALFRSASQKVKSVSAVPKARKPPPAPKPYRTPATNNLSAITSSSAESHATEPSSADAVGCTPSSRVTSSYVGNVASPLSAPVAAKRSPRLTRHTSSANDVLKDFLTTVKPPSAPPQTRAPERNVSFTSFQPFVSSSSARVEEEGE
ncbi:mucin-2-like [Sycon ciliatum]|uniref:mucin-2-like n=1 Tax=Sycon ciliatum TaxID=27933 RepID=UPI0031F628C8